LRSRDEPDLTDVVSDDRVLLTLQYSTQWDSFAHIGSRFDADGDGKREIVFYNGFAREKTCAASSKNDSEPWARYEGTEARALGIEKPRRARRAGPRRHDRPAPPLRPQAPRGGLRRADEADGPRTGSRWRKGDMVCLYTGFADLILEMRKQPDAKLLHASCSGLDGRDERLLQWISDSGLADPCKRQLCGGADSSEPFQAQAGGADAAARALPVQERHPPRRDVVSHRARALAAQPAAQAGSCSRRRRCACPARSARPRRRWDRMKVALITGGSSGMGEASARELAKRGWQVAIMFSKNKAQADRVAGDINGLALQGDVAQDADCRPRGEGGGRQMGPHRRAR
jgi:hypothetical protein